MRIQKYVINMYQVGFIVSHNKNRALIANALGVSIYNYSAAYEQYILELFGPFVTIKCEQIHDIIQVKNFVNRVSRILMANDEDVDRTIKIIGSADNDDEDCTDSDYDSDEEYSDDEY